MTRREKINFNLGFKLRQVNSFLILLLIFMFLPSALMAAGRARVKNISHHSFQGYTRVTIYLSGPVEFSKNRISKPDRLFFDLKGATLSKKIKASFNVRDGILKSVRARQFSKDTVRVVLDLEKTEDFKASLINKNKTTRLVIDIYGFKTAAKEPAPAPTKKPEIITPPLTKELVVTPPATTKEPAVITPALIKPETPVRTKEDAGNLIASGGKYIESGEYEKALLDFRKAAELSPGHPETYLFIGRSLFKLGEKEEAIAAYKQALEYDPNSADAYNGLGYAYYAQGKPSNAVDAFLMAIKLNPEHDDAHAGLGYTYLTLGDINSAIEHYRILKGLDSNKADELFHLIFKVQMKEQTKEQTKTFK